VLHDFVFGCVGSAALPEDVAGAQSRNGICRGKISLARLPRNDSCYRGLLLTLTNISEPDILQRAGTLAVDPFELVGTNNDVRDRRAIIENEHGAFVACVSICVASSSTVELFVAVVDGAGDDGGCGERNDGAGARGDVEGLGC
jgi:hypothetical protein